VTVCIPYDRTELVNLFHRAGQVEQETLEEDGTHIVGTIPGRLKARFAPFAHSVDLADSVVAT
jgi:hypothetical protein